MNPRRFATVAAAFCGTVVLAGWVVAWLAGFGSAGIENTGAVPIEDAAQHLSPPTPSSRMHRRQPQWATPLSPTPMWRRPPNR